MANISQVDYVIVITDDGREQFLENIKKGERLVLNPLSDFAIRFESIESARGFRNAALRSVSKEKIKIVPLTDKRSDQR